MSLSRLFCGLSAAVFLAGTACSASVDDAGTLLDASTDPLAEDAGRSGEPAEASTAGDGGACPDVPTLFAQTCAAGACHSATNMAVGLDLESPNLAFRLVGACATEGTGPLLDPSDPQASVIYTKLTKTPPFGNQMPLAQPAFGEATLACVLAWASAQSGPQDTCAPGGGDDAGEDAGTGDASTKDGGKKPEDAGTDAGKKKDAGKE